MLNAPVSSLSLNRVWARRPICQCGKEVKPGMVWMFPFCSTMQQFRSSWLTVNPYLPTFMSRDDNLDSAVSKAEGEGCGREIKARGPPGLVSCPLAAQRTGSGLSWDLAQ